MTKLQEMQFIGDDIEVAQREVARLRRAWVSLPVDEDNIKAWHCRNRAMLDLTAASNALEDAYTWAQKLIEDEACPA